MSRLSRDDSGVDRLSRRDGDQRSQTWHTGLRSNFTPPSNAVSSRPSTRYGVEERGRHANDARSRHRDDRFISASRSNDRNDTTYTRQRDWYDGDNRSMDGRSEKRLRRRSRSPLDRANRDGDTTRGVPHRPSVTYGNRESHMHNSSSFRGRDELDSSSGLSGWLDEADHSMGSNDAKQLQDLRSVSLNLDAKGVDYNK